MIKADQLFSNPYLMELSIFLAKIIAVVYVVVGLGILFNTAYYHKATHSYMKDSALMYQSGILALLVGIVLVLTHNNWVKDWTVLITIFGWLALVKGVVLILFPKVTKLFTSWFKKKSFFPMMGLLTIVLGVVFGYFGFFY
jgi:hypothetical protein